MSNQPEEIRALTWREPFATLMLHGKIETRVWPTNYRGWVAIHAGKAQYKGEEVKEMSGDHYGRILDTIAEEEYNLGHIIAVGRLIDCRPMVPADEAKCFVKFNPKLWCHVYTDIVRLTVPIPFQGKQGWARLNPKFIRENLPVEIFRETAQQEIF